MTDDVRMKSQRGRLLIAGGGLLDPNFRRTVVLIGEHDEEGAVGVVLNRPTPVVVAEAIPPLAHLVTADELLFVGGPVQPTSVVVVADFEDPARAGLLAFGSIGFLVGDVEPEQVEGVHRARIFAGFAGWGAGQLEEELEEGAWITDPAVSEDVFAEDPTHLWSSVLRRKGPEFRLLSMMPLDPSLN
jgi:putative transcriptional regulator